MAGETTKTLLRTDHDNKVKSPARVIRGNTVEARDYHAYTTGELEATDVLLTGIKIPSNGIVTEILVYNDDLDSNGTPTLAVDVGLYATKRFTSTTSSTDTIHAADAILDADLLVDGATDLQAATTKYTSLALDATTFGPDDAYKPMWEVLGYDEDPQVEFGVAVTVATAAATAAAGDVMYLVRYTTD